MGTILFALLSFLFAKSLPLRSRVRKAFYDGLQWYVAWSLYEHLSPHMSQGLSEAIMSVIFGYLVSLLIPPAPKGMNPKDNTSSSSPAHDTPLSFYVQDRGSVVGQSTTSSAGGNTFAQHKDPAGYEDEDDLP